MKSLRDIIARGFPGEAFSRSANGWEPWQLGDLDEPRRLVVRRYARDRDLSVLAELDPSAIEELDCSDTRIAGPGLQAIARLGGLVSLSLEGLSLDGGALGFLRALGGLKSLSVARSTVIGSDLWPHLESLSGLRSLNLYRTAMGDGDLAAVSRLRDLRYLNLAVTTVTDAGLPLLGELGELRELNLSGSLTEGSGLHALAGLPALEALRLTGAACDDSIASSLAALKALKVLDLSMTAIGDRAVTAAAALPHLRDLNLDRTRTGNAGFRALEKAGRLDRLIASRLDLDDKALSTIGEMQRLRVLGLHGSALAPHAAEALIPLRGL